VIAHIVLFEPKPELTEGERRQFLATLRTAVSRIPEIKTARVGRTLSFLQMPENIIGLKTYSFAAILEFEDAANLQGYLQHPEHNPVREAFWKACSATLIVDVAVGDVELGSADLLV
jgi:hypothetical protein